MSQNAVIFLVLCGLVVLFATGAMRRSSEQDRRTGERELMLAASETALAVLDRADALPFDGRLRTARVASAQDLTPLPFPRGGAFTSALDLDDLHEHTPRTLTHPASGEAFEVTARVEYVDAQDRVSPAQTMAKRVVAVARHPELTRPVELARIYELEL